MNQHKELHDFMVAKANKIKHKKTRHLAKKLYKEVFPNSSLSCLSGHSTMFEKFIEIAEKLQNGTLDKNVTSLFVKEIA